MHMARVGAERRYVEIGQNVFPRETPLLCPVSCTVRTHVGAIVRNVQAQVTIAIVVGPRRADAVARVPMPAALVTSVKVPSPSFW